MPTALASAARTAGSDRYSARRWGTRPPPRAPPLDPRRTASRRADPGVHPRRLRTNARAASRRATAAAASARSSVYASELPRVGHEVRIVASPECDRELADDRRDRFNVLCEDHAIHIGIAKAAVDGSDLRAAPLHEPGRRAEARSPHAARPVGEYEYLRASALEPAVQAELVTGVSDEEDRRTRRKDCCYHVCNLAFAVPASK
jgi:hypothetical protein